MVVGTPCWVCALGEGGTADDAGVVAQGRGFKADVLRRSGQGHTQGPLPNVVLEVGTQGTRNAAAENDHFGTHQIDDAGNRRGNRPCRLVDDLPRHGVAGQVQVGKLRAFHSLEVDLFPRLANAFGGIAENLFRSFQLAAASGNVFELRAAFPLQNRMADLPGVAVKAAVDLAIKDERAADAGSREDAEDMLRADGDAMGELAVGAHADVVFQDKWANSTFRA